MDLHFPVLEDKNLGQELVEYPTSGLFLFEFPPQLQTEQTSLQDNTRMSIICRQQLQIYPNCTQDRKLLMTFMQEVRQENANYSSHNVRLLSS